MSDNAAAPETFGWLIANVATWAAICAFRRANLGPDGQLHDLTSELAARVLHAREDLAEADAQLDAAVAALDAAIGLTPAQLTQIGDELDKTLGQRREALPAVVSLPHPER